MTEEKTTAPSETVNESTGIVDANPNDFLADGEGQADKEQGETTQEVNKEEKNEETTEENPSKDKETETTKKEDTETENPEKGKSEKSDEDKLYAGKFKTEDDLRAAYQELGGDPTRYTEPGKLEEAYLVRQAEFTRSRQDISDKEKKDKPQDDKQPTDDDLLNEIVENIDYSKVQNAKDAIREAVKASVEIMKKYQRPGVDEKQLVEKLTPAIKEREEKVKALTTLENDVPRLKKDPFFREQFAHYVIKHQNDDDVINEQKDGQLGKLMSKFLDNYTSILEEAGKIKQQTIQKKRSAQPPPDNGDGAKSDNEKEDEVSGILNAFEERKAKFGG